MYLHAEQGITPDRFVLLKYKDQYAILAAGHGSQADADTWRRSTAIKSVEKEDDTYFVKTNSGSEYALKLVRVGFTYLTSSIWHQIEDLDNGIDVELIHEQSDIEAILNSFMVDSNA